MPVDPSISLGVKPFEAPNLLQYALQGQQLRNQNLEGNNLQQSMGANQAVSQAIQHNTGPDGTVDLPGVQKELAGNPAAGYNLQATTGANITQQQGQAKLSSDQLALQMQRLGAMNTQLGAHIDDKDISLPKYIGWAAQTIKQFNLPPTMMQKVLEGVQGLQDPNDPEQLRGLLRQKQLEVQSAQDQLSKTTASPGVVNNNQQQLTRDNNPNSPTFGQQIMAPVQNQQSPDTPVYDPTTNSYRYLGPQPSTAPAGTPQASTPTPQPSGLPANSLTGAMGATPASQPSAGNNLLPAMGTNPAPSAAPQPQPAQLTPNGPVSAPGLGAGQIAGNVADDFAHVSQAAQSASQNIGVLQEIKKHAPGAITGGEADRRAYIAKLAAYFNVSGADDASANTDLLLKNANMLASQGGHTDAERVLASAMNPNNHMQQSAILKAADQVIAQQQLALARQKVLQPYVNNPTLYNQVSTQFNQVADPRVLQLPSMSQADKVAMKKAMSPQEQVDFGKKIRAFQSMGLLQ